MMKYRGVAEKDRGPSQFDYTKGREAGSQADPCRNLAAKAVPRSIASPPETLHIPVRCNACRPGRGRLAREWLFAGKHRSHRPIGFFNFDMSTLQKVM